MNTKVKKTLPIMLSILAAGGVVGSNILTAKETVKNKEAMDEALKTKDKKVIVKTFIKSYKWSLLSGAATIASIVSGTIISKKVEASLSATVIMLDGALRKYKGKAKELLGDEVNKITKSIAIDDAKKMDIKQAPVNTNKRKKILYHEEHIGFFYAYPESLDKAMAITNEKILTSYEGKERITTDHWASLRTFLEDCNADIPEEGNQHIDEISYDYGWTAEYVSSVYGGNDIFVHLKKTPIKDEESGLEFIEIEFDKDPVYNPMDYMNWPSEKYDNEIAAGQDEEAYYDVKDIEKAENVAQRMLERNK